MSSRHERVKGGGFGKENRFPKSAETARNSPGPHYDIPSSFSKSTHIQGHIYKPLSGVSRVPKKLDLPHPSKERTAWVIGTVKGGMSYYNDLADHGGPANYNQDVTPIKHHSPTNAFSKEDRFGQGSRTKQFISHEHNITNLCTESQGPKYLPRTHLMDLKSPKPPSYSFGSKNVSDRSLFINKQVKGGYLYESKPATSGKNTSVDSATYSPNYKVLKNRSPTGQWGRADRFVASEKTFISPKHSKIQAGHSSPGPVYNPRNFDVSRSKKMAVSTQVGKWCP